MPRGLIPCLAIIFVLIGGSSFAATIGAAGNSTVTDLVISKSHSGNFTQGVTGKVYTLFVKNSGGEPTTGAVTVTDILPVGLTATEIAGTGWTCAVGTLTCTRNDVLGASSIYPVIKVTVNVATDAPAQVVNTATVSGGGDSNITNNTASDTTTIWSSQACGGFGWALNYPTQSYPKAVALGDFNHDGKADLVATTSSSVSVVLGNANGTFATGRSYPIFASPRDVAVTDLDNDGNEDLVTINYDSSNFSVLLGDGAGAFGAAVSYFMGSGSYPAAVAVGDFNADGNNDLAVTHVLWNGSEGGTSIFLGNGDGTLQTAAIQIAGSGPLGVITADLDNDGKLDLVVANSRSNTISILRGNGDGTFEAPVSQTVGFGGPRSLAAGDLNVDGKLDLVVIPDLGSAEVLIGNGDATFQVPVRYEPSSLSGGTVVIEDFNGDGISDIAASSTATITVLRGNGDGTFLKTSSHKLGFAASRFVVGDFNGDGKPDLAVPNQNENVLAVLSGGCADLTITKSHEGDFRNGQSGAQYSLAVKNVGAASTSEMITVTDVLPAGLTASSMSGVPWICDESTVTCTTKDLAAGASSPITLHVNVAGDAPTSVVNTATVSGGGDNNHANDSDSDPTTIVRGPDLSIETIHSEVFAEQTQHTYTIYVSNVGNQPTTGTVTVVDAVPDALIPWALTGDGWECTLATRSCTRNDALPAGGEYPAIVLTVRVVVNAPESVTNVATVSGGGDVTANNNTKSSLTKILGYARNFVATATSATQVSLSWSSVTHATHYRVMRGSFDSVGFTFSFVGYAYSNSYVDGSLPAGTAALYRVHPVNGVIGPPSLCDLATTVVFTDDSLQPGVTTIKKAHLTELRTAVNAVRALAQMQPADFTDPTLPETVPVKAIHITELRAALNAARSYLAVTDPITYVDPTLSAGMVVKAAHVNDLRLGVK